MVGSGTDMSLCYDWQVNRDLVVDFRQYTFCRKEWTERPWLDTTWMTFDCLKYSPAGRTWQVVSKWWHKITKILLESWICRKLHMLFVLFSFNTISIRVDECEYWVTTYYLLSIAMFRDLFASVMSDVWGSIDVMRWCFIWFECLSCIATIYVWCVGEYWCNEVVFYLVWVFVLHSYHICLMCGRVLM